MILSFTWCLLLFLNFECKYQHTMDSENRLDFKTQTLLQTRIVDFCCSLLLIGHRALNVVCLFKANSSRGWKWKEIKVDQATWARLDFNWPSTKLLTRRRSGGLICGKVGWLDIPAVCIIGLLSQRVLCCFVISSGNDWRCLRRMLEYFQWFSKGTRTRYLEKRWVNAVKSQPSLCIITKQKQGGTYSILYITTETALQTQPLKQEYLTLICERMRELCTKVIFPGKRNILAWKKQTEGKKCSKSNHFRKDW